jgi:hypothetical protein
MYAWHTSINKPREPGQRHSRSANHLSLAWGTYGVAPAPLNVGVDQRAPARRRKTYAPAYGLRSLVSACRCRTTC